MELIAPEACTLPTAEQPLRVAEFVHLFAAVRSVVTDGPTRATLRLGAPADQVRDLARRESRCCSFFRFGVTPTGASDVTLDIEVPPEHADVLAALLRLVP